jgi:hypothetical protein
MQKLGWNRTTKLQDDDFWLPLEKYRVELLNWLWCLITYYTVLENVQNTKILRYLLGTDGSHKGEPTELSSTSIDGEWGMSSQWRGLTEYKTERLTVEHNGAMLRTLSRSLCRFQKRVSAEHFQVRCNMLWGIKVNSISIWPLHFVT